ncbi:hypothetical protein BDW22DRAFT_1078759 [Trametopsis cervina]|nr:hypothetical protein BDW22DRAFT_1078759 [Trametopsis cervina]
MPPAHAALSERARSRGVQCSRTSLSRTPISTAIAAVVPSWMDGVVGLSNPPRSLTLKPSARCTSSVSGPSSISVAQEKGSCYRHPLSSPHRSFRVHTLANLCVCTPSMLPRRIHPACPPFNAFSAAADNLPCWQPASGAISPIRHSRRGRRSAPALYDFIPSYLPLAPSQSS